MPEIGDSLGRYTLLKRLASGGMGEVFLAAKPGPVGFGPRVALKVLRDQLATDQQFIDMLVDEANISMFLNHQNVVSVLDLAEDHGTYYIAMEFVQGVTVEGLLEKLIAQGRKLELPIALYIASELCRALKYAHTRVNHAGEPLNIIHRDVTPANILLSVQGEVKLTDFGIARAKGRIHQTQAGVLKGKFGYMAPEMIRYEAIDARADLFCAGVVIYLMITGKHPVAGSTVMEAIQRYEDKQIPKPSAISADIPPSLDAIVMRCMEPKPDQRWSSAAALGAALQEAVLKHPAWRREVQDGAGRLSDLIRELSPDVFQDPIPPEVSDRLLKNALSAEQALLKPMPVAIPHVDSAAETKLPSGPRPVVRRDMSGPVTDRAAEALISSSSESPMPVAYSGNGNGAGFKPTVTNPDLETEEGLALADVFAARDELRREMPQPKQVTLKKSSKERRNVSEMKPDVIERADDIPTGLQPIEATLALPAITDKDERASSVTFPDSSTDRHRLHEVMLEEGELPPKRPETTKKEPFDWEGSRPSDPEAANEATVAGFHYDAHDQTDRPPSSSTDDGRTVVGMYGLAPSDPAMAMTPRDTDENRIALSEPELPELPDLPEIGSENSDDGKTLMGVSMPDFIEIEKPVVMTQPSKDDFKNDADATRAYAAIDAPQVPPVSKSSNGSKRVHKQDDAETVIPMGPDPGWDPHPSEKDYNDATLLDGMDANSVQEALAKQRAAQTDARKLDQAKMDKIIADSLVTGEHTAIASESGGPALFQGPVRIQFNTAGTPVLGSEEAAAALAAVAEPATPAKKKIIAPGVRNKKETSAPPVSDPKDNLDVGANTGKWIAGELESNKLDWSDDAAARRAVAARNRPAHQSPPRGTNVGQHPSHGMAHPGIMQPGVTPGPRYPVPSSIPPRQSSFARNWTVIVALFAAVLAVGVVSAVLLFTNLLWPKLRLESDPVGALVIVDGLEVQGRAPVTVKVEPEKTHTIEFRMDGYRPERREITDGVGRGRTYALQVSLRRVVPTFELNGVNGTIFLNGKEAGRGMRLQLADIPMDQPVRIRIEADGYKAWERSFDRGALVPESIDVPLERIPAEEKPQPKKTR
jgi:serine/threonine protein kinase